MPVTVEQAISQLVALVTGSDEGAIAYALDPSGTTGAAGLEGQYAQGIDVRQIVSDYCNDPSVPYDVRQQLQSYTSGQSGPPGPAYSQADVVQHLNHVTYVTHENNQQVTNIIDQSRDIINDNDIDIDVPEGYEGDINVDQDNLSNTGDRGAVANNEGDGDINQATGDESQNVTGDGATGNTGDNSNVLGGNASNSGPLVAGNNSGIVNDDGTVTDNVLGDGNRVVDTDGGNIDGPVLLGDFGSGSNVTTVNDATVTGSQVGVTGDATNIAGNTVGAGGAIGGRDASGNAEQTQVQVQNLGGNVAVETGQGDQHSQQDLDFPDFDPEPKRLEEKEAEPEPDPISE